MAQTDDFYTTQAEHVAQAWADMRVDMDGACFVDCAFVRCTMVYAGGLLPCFVGTTRLQDCELTLEGAADRTFELLKLLYDNAGSDLAEKLFDQVRRGEAR